MYELFEELINIIFLSPRFQLWLILYTVSCILLANPLYHLAIIQFERAAERDRRKLGLDPEDENPYGWTNYFWFPLMAIFYIVIPILFASLLYWVFSSGNFLSQLHWVLINDRM